MTQNEVPGATGTADDPRVRAALSALDDLERLDLPAQLEVFAGLQTDLARILDSADVQSAAPTTAPWAVTR